MTQSDKSVLLHEGRWYWRIDIDHSMTPGHGTAATRAGAVEQIGALLLHSPDVVWAEDAAPEIRLTLQAPAGTYLHAR